MKNLTLNLFFLSYALTRTLTKKFRGKLIVFYDLSFSYRFFGVNDSYGPISKKIAFWRRIPFKHWSKFRIRISPNNPRFKPNFFMFLKVGSMDIFKNYGQFLRYSNPKQNQRSLRGAGFQISLNHFQILSSVPFRGNPSLSRVEAWRLYHQREFY